MMLWELRSVLPVRCLMMAAVRAVLETLPVASSQE
jgi:hypothetical protein